MARRAPDRTRGAPSGWRSSHCAILSADAQCRSMRSASVLRPRSARKESNGPWIAPTAFCRKRQPLAQLGVLAHHRDAADHVGMAVEIFRGRMHHDVEAVLERALDIGAGKGVVGGGPDAAALRDRGHAFEVDELQQRIGRRLDPDEPRVRPDRAPSSASASVQIDDRSSRARPSACARARTAGASRRRDRRPPRYASRGRGNRAWSRSRQARRRRQSRRCRLRDRRCSARTPCGSGSWCAHSRSPCARPGSAARRSRSRRSASSRRRSSGPAPARHARSGSRSRGSEISSSRSRRDPEIVDEVEPRRDADETGRRPSRWRCSPCGTAAPDRRSARRPRWSRAASP